MRMEWTQVFRWMRSMARPAPLGAGVPVAEQIVTPRPVPAAAFGICAFVGAFSQGPAGKAVTVAGRGEFDQLFGGPQGLGEAPAAVAQFFANGGAEALLVRTASTSATSLDEGLGVLDGLIDPGFDLLCVPDAVHVPDRCAALYEKALAICVRQRATLLVDPPPGLAGDAGILAWLNGVPGLRSADAALYYPRLRLDGGADAGPSGSVAGIVARFGRERGVWKAPAGPGAGLLGAVVEDTISTQRQELLNPQGVNVIRAMGSAGPLVWGSRTLSSDPEWKYLSVRRTVLFLERSLRQGLQWAVFEPNDEPLWASIRASVDGFLQELWRAGALMGQTARDALFVRCGSDTTVEADIREGRICLVVGVALVRPAEFLTFRMIVQAAAPPVA